MQDKKFHKTIAKSQCFPLKIHRLILNENNTFSGIPGLRSRWMIPCECKHSIARAISRANPTATRISKHFGRILNRYLRNVPPNRSSVTITITGSLQAPINWHQTKTKCNILETIYFPVNHYQHSLLSILVEVNIIRFWIGEKVPWLNFCVELSTT